MGYRIIGKPLVAVCAGCQQTIKGDDIVRYEASSWAAWCWPCFKKVHLPNLARLQEISDAP